MATTVWHGHLTFGLVSIPVRLFKAARSEKVRFHQLYKPKRAAADVAVPDPGPNRRLDAVGPVGPKAVPPRQVFEPEPAEQYRRTRQNVYVAEEEPSGFASAASRPEPIPRAELVKGYKYDKNRYVVVDPEDLKNITPQTATEMEILEFVTLEEIDPIYFETSYYVVPEEAGEKAYALLFEAMRETHFVALAEIAMHRKEHVMVLRPGKHGLVAHTMFYSDEIRANQEYRANTSLAGGRELDMAKLLIQSLAAPFEPGKYRDKFREKLQALIDAKVQGRQVAQISTAREPAAVVDILQALENSLKLVRKPAGSVASEGSSKPVQPSTSRKSRQRRAGT
jgi:DNA end-binding protein Ku